jgi:hypothetical protein
MWPEKSCFVFLHSNPSWLEHTLYIIEGVQINCNAAVTLFFMFFTSCTLLPYGIRKLLSWAADLHHAAIRQEALRRYGRIGRQIVVQKERTNCLYLKTVANVSKSISIALPALACRIHYRLSFPQAQSVFGSHLAYRKIQSKLFWAMTFASENFCI